MTSSIAFFHKELVKWLDTTDVISYSSTCKTNRLILRYVIHWSPNPYSHDKALTVLTSVMYVNFRHREGRYWQLTLDCLTPVKESLKFLRMTSIPPIKGSYPTFPNLEVLDVGGINPKDVVEVKGAQSVFVKTRVILRDIIQSTNKLTRLNVDAAVFIYDHNETPSSSNHRLAYTGTSLKSLSLTRINRWTIFQRAHFKTLAGLERLSFSSGTTWSNVMFDKNCFDDLMLQKLTIQCLALVTSNFESMSCLLSSQTSLKYLNMVCQVDEVCHLTTLTSLQSLSLDIQCPPFGSNTHHNDDMMHDRYDITPLFLVLTNLQRLALRYTHSNVLLDGSVLTRLTMLKKLHIPANGLNGVFPSLCASLANLVEITIPYHNVYQQIDISPLRQLATLKSLNANLSNSVLNGAETISNLTTLESLYVTVSSYVPMEDHFLSKLTRLKRLSVIKSAVDESLPIVLNHPVFQARVTHLTNLRTLEVNVKSTLDWSQLGCLTSLRILSVPSLNVSPPHGFFKPFVHMTNLCLSEAFKIDCKELIHMTELVSLKCKLLTVHSIHYLREYMPNLQDVGSLGL